MSKTKHTHFSIWRKYSNFGATPESSEGKRIKIQILIPNKSSIKPEHYMGHYSEPKYLKQNKHWIQQIQKGEFKIKQNEEREEKLDARESRWWRLTEDDYILLCYFFCVWGNYSLFVTQSMRERNTHINAWIQIDVTCWATI